MKGNKRMLVAIFCVNSLCLSAQGIDMIIDGLKNINCYSATVNYQVLMSLQDDVNYNLKLYSESAPNDTLSPASYLIDWTYIAKNGESKGFSAYYDGNLYNFRGDRLIEYHYEWDATPFRPSGSKSLMLPGIQQRMQFVNLLPGFIANELTTIKNDKENYAYKFHPDTIVASKRCRAIDGTMRVDGVLYKEFLYAFDYTTLRPVFIENENNPGGLAEQTISASYVYPSEKTECISLNEEKLRNLYPEIFEKFRESNYAIENMAGQRLPGFSLPTSTEGRYTRHLGDPFRCPTLVVLIDPKSQFATPTINSIRNAVDNLPFNMDVIWAFVSNNIDEIDNVIERAREGENILISAKSLARDCGAGAFPVTIITNTDGTVADVIVGYNNDLTSNVIQKAALTARK